MKKLCWFLVGILVLGCMPVLGEEAPVVDTYTAVFGTKQGVDNWYYCEFGKTDVTELAWDSANSRWKGLGTYPLMGRQDMSPANTSDVGFKFVAPTKGMVRLRGTVSHPYESNGKGNGVVAIICKGNKELWSSSVKYGSDASYDITTSVRQGDELYFKVNAYKNSNPYDWTVWWPTVEYLGIEYVPEAEEYTYFEKSGDTLTQLEYNSDKDGYPASDGIGFINSRNVMPGEDYSLVRRYDVKEYGRYRVTGTLLTDDTRSSGNVIAVLKNGEKVWEQLFLPGEEGKIDVGMMAIEGDTIDVEVKINEFEGYNNATWSYDVNKYLGTLFCNASTSQGYNCIKDKEFTLGSLVGTVQGIGGVSYYTLKDDVKYEMKYNASTKRWESPVAGDGGYISQEIAYPGTRSASIVEVILSENGVLKIDGDLKISDSGDGVLSKIYLNGNVIWSSRVGGERSNRWDEPFDVCYFLNTVNVMANVKAGDKLEFTFAKWRKAVNDNVSINNVTLSYVNGETLSKTTKWKLKNSTVVDTERKSVYVNGVEQEADVRLESGTTYIAADDIEKVFGKGTTSDKTPVVIDGTNYLPLRAIAEDNGKNVTWAADRVVLIYSGIPVLFGYPELSEIDVTLKNGGELF